MPARAAGLFMAITLGGIAAVTSSWSISANDVEPPSTTAITAAPPSPAPPAVSVITLSLNTVTLVPPLGLGGEDIRSVRIRAALGGGGTMELDPNPVTLDRFGNVSKTGLRAVPKLNITLAALSAATGDAGWRAFDVRPAPPAPAWPEKLGLRLAAGHGACGPYRLLVVDEAGAVVRVITLESEQP